MEQPKDLFEQYIETIEAKQARINANGMWKWIKEYEATAETPFVLSKPDQLIKMLNSRCSTSPSTIRTYILMMRSFFKWADSCGYCKDNPAMEISYKDVDYVTGVKETYWPNYSALLNILNTVWTPDDGLPVYPVTAFAWVGVPLKEAGTIEKEQVDIENKYIETERVRLCFDEEIADILLRYDSFSCARRDNNMTMIRTYTSNAFLYRLAIQNRTTSDTSTNQVDAANVLAVASKTLTAHNLCKPLKYSELAKSGWLHRMYLMERNGRQLSDILDCGRNGLNTPAAYPGDALLMYNAYKKAFNLK